MKTNTTSATNRLAGCWRHLMGVLATVAILVPAAMAGHPELPLDLGTAGDFVILAKTGISTVPSADITGDMGVSPIFSPAITGFSLIMDISGEFSTSAQVDGKIYAADYISPTPTKMTAAISDMETAFTQASLRTIPDTTELMFGNISGLTITPGLHKWSSDVLINSDVTLDAQGSADAIFIFQISGDLLVASGQSVLLAAGAQAKNIFWQIEGPVGAVVDTTAHIEGVILTAKAITIKTGASFNGKLLAQTRVDLDQNIGVDSDLIPPEQLILEIISEHGTADLPVGIYTNDYGTLLTNTVTGTETLGGTQFVNTGWSMIGNDPALGTTNYMEMAHTNDAVLTWQWSTNYMLSLSATNGAITNATAGWKPSGDAFALIAVADPGYTFNHWEVNGIDQGSISPLNVTMDQEQDVLAVFAPTMFGNVSWNVTWLFDPRLGFYIGTLTIINPSDSPSALSAPFWFKIQSTEWYWLRFPTGVDAVSGMHYVDLSGTIQSLLAGIGNGDQVLDPGESVSVGGIELMGRRTPDGLVMDLEYESKLAIGDSLPLVIEDPVEMSPSGGAVLNTRRPVFSWPTAADASWYQLWITRNGQTYLQQWVQESTTWVPAVDMQSGSYRWWVRSWSLESGYGAWSDAADFSIALMIPGSLVQIAPSGVQSENALVYGWEKDANATWYRLWVGRVGGGTVHDRWYAMSGVGEASVAVGGLLQGDYTWWVVGWSPDGKGPWAGPTGFSTPDPAPGKPVLIAPEGISANTEPLFEWEAAPKAEWYRVYVASSSGAVIDQWTQDTSLASPVMLSSGAHSWWVGAWNSLSTRTTWSDRADFTDQ